MAIGRPGDRLPSVRQLMAELGVSPATVRHAVSDLVRTGRVEAISGSGTFIAIPQERLPPRSDTSWQTLALGADALEHHEARILEPIRSLVPAGVIDLASGYPDESLQPQSLIASAVRESVRRPGVFGRVASEGSEPLRHWFEENIDPERQHRALIMPGGQAALALVFRALCLPGDAVMVESPTYAGALVAIRAAGLVPVPVPTDSDGLRVDQIGAAVAANGCRVLYIQPRFHNPTGASLSAERRTQLIGLAEEHGLIIVEDDWIADLALDGKYVGPLASIDPHGHVVHIRSLTKSIAPGIRVAAIAAVGALATRLYQVRSAEDFFVSPLLQETALRVVTSPRWPGHLRRLRVALQQRKSQLWEQVQRLGGTQMVSGDGQAIPSPLHSVSPLHLWLRVEGLGPDNDLRSAALRQGVSVVTGSDWLPGSSSGKHVRLSNAAATKDEMAEGVDRFGRALQELRTGRA